MGDKDSMKIALDNLGEKYLRNEFLTSTFLAGLATRNEVNPVYGKNVGVSLRSEFKTYLRHRLDYFSKMYVSSISSSDHTQNLLKISKEISGSKYSKILHRGVFRIGVAQKLLNLFLKFLWVSKYIPEPPHCPFDSVVKSGLLRYSQGYVLADWTTLNDIDEYLAYVSCAERAADDAGTSIAVWELMFWNNTMIP